MAKTIKFNLICDEKPIRTIEDLQNNFSIEDVLTYYNNGLLERWLQVRGYEKELDAVKKITETTPMDIVKKLIKIFRIEIDSKKVEESVYILQYLDEKKELLNIYEKQKSNIKSIIDDYEVGYTNLIDDIVNNPDDIAKIKANIKSIVDDYSWILKLDNRRILYLLKDISPLAIMCLLMNEKSRCYYLPNQEVESTNEKNRFDANDDINEDKREMYEIICDLIIKKDFIDKLGNKVLSFAGVTDGYWKDIEPNGKKYMIVRMENGNYVRSAGVQGGDLAYSDIKNKFVIVDGIDYKSNSPEDKLLYMEV